MEQDLPYASHYFGLLCLRARLNACALEQARDYAASRDVDWQEFLGWAEGEGLCPLLFQILRNQRIVPPAIEESLRFSYYANAGRALLIINDLHIINQCLSKVGISMMLLKGAALLNSVYQNPALRPMLDIDILVRHEQVYTAVEQLVALGYQPLKLDTRSGDSLFHESEIQLKKPAQPSILLELHWNLIDSVFHQTMMKLDWFWQSAQRVSTTQLHAYIAGPEGQLLHLCAHLFMHHTGTGYMWRHDIAEVLTTYRHSLNWDLVASKAIEWHLVIPLQRALPLIVRDWHVDIAPDAINQINALPVSRSEQRAFDYVQSAHTSVANHFVADFVSMPDWQSRLRYTFNNLLPSWQYMQQRYKVRNPLHTLLYYPWRWYIGIRSAINSRASLRNE
jgi:hypothetical protein